MAELQTISAATMRFMRGEYMLDEVGNGNDELTFRDGRENILTIYIRDGYYDFAVGQERIRVADMDALEKAKALIHAAKKPNRKPFPKEQAIYGGCGHRCDLCVHYTGGTVSEELRKKMQDGVRRVYGMKPEDEFPLCSGCLSGGISGKFDCEPIQCAKEKGASRCVDCAEYDCGNGTAGRKPAIEARSVSADDVTWAILPYVDGQYGN